MLHPLPLICRRRWEGGAKLCDLVIELLKLLVRFRILSDHIVQA